MYQRASEGATRRAAGRGYGPEAAVEYEFHERMSDRWPTVVRHGYRRLKSMRPDPSHRATHWSPVRRNLAGMHEE